MRWMREGGETPLVSIKFAVSPPVTWRGGEGEVDEGGGKIPVCPSNLRSVPQRCGEEAKVRWMREGEVDAPQSVKRCVCLPVTWKVGQE